MKILVIGSGGREHALVWKLAQSPAVEQVYCAPGNAGISREAVCCPAVPTPAAAVELAAEIGASLTVVGPEAPLVAGIGDAFRARGLPILGPSAAAAQLEGSKIFAKQFLREHSIPTADFLVLESAADVPANIGRFGFPVVLKADGLAAGKGVIILHDPAEARMTAERMLEGGLVSDAGRRTVLEPFLQGREVSFIILTDGKNRHVLPPTQDHKALYDDDRGPNTGGMGAYSDPEILSEPERRQILDRIVDPTLEAMGRRQTPYQGFLYFGLMMTAEGPQVLEFNVRLGDPETQPMLFRMESDLAEWLEAAAHGSLPGQGPAWGQEPAVCVVAASEGYPGAYEQGIEILGVDDAEALGAKVFQAGTRFHQGRLVTSGGRVLGVTAGGADLREAIDNAYQGIAKVRFNGMHYRRDIGHKGLREAGILSAGKHQHG